MANVQLSTLGSVITPAYEGVSDTVLKKYIGATTDATASYGLILTDAGKIVEMTSGSANDIVIPANAAIAFPVNTRIDIIQYDAGLTTITITSDTLTGEVVSTGQYKAMSLWKRAATEWVVFGGTT